MGRARTIPYFLPRPVLQPVAVRERVGVRVFCGVVVARPPNFGLDMPRAAATPPMPAYLAGACSIAVNHRSDA